MIKTSTEFVVSRRYTIEVYMEDGNLVFIEVPLPDGPSVMKILQTMIRMNLASKETTLQILPWTRWNTQDGLNSDERALNIIACALGMTDKLSDLKIKKLGRVTRTTVEEVSPWSV